MEDLHDNFEASDGFEGLSLGERLRQYRERAGMSVEQAAREIKIALRYVRALEDGDWAVFSARVYAQGSARRMAKLFAGANADALVAAVGREWDIARGGAEAGAYSSPRAVAVPRRFTLTPRRLGVAGAMGAGLLLATFLSIRLTAFIAAPGLTIKSPADRSGFDTPLVDVAGKTEKESSLTVNGREITLDGQGNFDEKIELQSGANALHFISRNRFGKTQTVERNIFVE